MTQAARCSWLRARNVDSSTLLCTTPSLVRSAVGSHANVLVADDVRLYDVLRAMNSNPCAEVIARYRTTGGRRRANPDGWRSTLTASTRPPGGPFLDSPRATDVAAHARPHQTQSVARGDVLPINARPERCDANGLEKVLTHPTKRSGHRHAREPHDVRRFVSDQDGYNVEGDGDDARRSRGPQ